MDLTSAIGLAVLTEIIFVVSFTGLEVMHYTLRERITRVEQRAHSLPQGRYSADVFNPVITMVVSAAVGVGAGTMGNVHQGPFGPILGYAILMATLIPFFCYLVNRAAGITPRPVTRASVRRLLADTARRLDTATSPLPLTEAAQMRDRLTRVMRVGDRLMHQSQTWRWREAIQREHRLLTGSVMLSVLFWMANGSVAAVRLSHGVDRSLVSLGLSLALLAILVAGISLRGTRYRRDRHDLGAELCTESSRLLTRLEAVSSQAAPRSRRAGLLAGLRPTALLGLLERTYTPGQSNWSRALPGFAGLWK